MAAKLFTISLLAALTLAKTDIGGCTSSAVYITPSGRPDLQPYQSVIWWVEDTGEICELLDCGGGRAPPKTDVPGCGNYKGTDTYSPRFMPTSTSTTEEAVPTASATDDSEAPEETGEGESDTTEGEDDTEEGDETEGGDDTEVDDDTEGGDDTEGDDTEGSDETDAEEDAEGAEEGDESDDSAATVTPNAAPAPTAFVGGILAAGIAAGLGML